MIRKKSSAKVAVSRNRIVRAVASSSAIEAGESIKVIEQRLRSGTRRFTKLSLAIHTS